MWTEDPCLHSFTVVLSVLVLVGLKFNSSAHPLRDDSTTRPPLQTRNPWLILHSLASRESRRCSNSPFFQPNGAQSTYITHLLSPAFALFKRKGTQSIHRRYSIHITLPLCPTLPDSSYDSFACSGNIPQLQQHSSVDASSLFSTQGFKSSSPH